MNIYRKRRRIRWAKLLRFSWFQEYLESFSMKVFLFNFINNEYLCTAYGQGNAKIFLQKLWWHWNRKHLAQCIFPIYSSLIVWRSILQSNWLSLQIFLTYRNYNWWSTLLASLIVIESFPKILRKTQFNLWAHSVEFWQLL